MTSTFRRLVTLPLAAFVVFTAACSDSSLTGPSVGNARKIGYTVPADGAPSPVGAGSTTTKKSGPTTTSRSGYTVPADALPTVPPTTSVITTSVSGR